MEQKLPPARPAQSARLQLADVLVALAIMAVCVAMRIATLGDTNYHDDDLFYFLVGQRMHDGALPYVDVWDRKPLGLFIIYYFIAGISRHIWTYQIVGWCFLAATGWVIHRIVLFWTNRQGGLLAGMAYVVITFTYGGDNGQAPVFYNLFMVTAFLLTMREFPSLDRGRCNPGIWAAMALCGVAITVKQTSLFESLFLGGAVLFALLRSGMGKARLAGLSLGLAAVGAAPMLAIAAAYWWMGHWPEFWNAMLRANLQRQSIGVSKGLIWNIAVPIRAIVILPIAGWALASLIRERRVRNFLVGWLAAALIGFLSVANFFVHYALPMLVPLCVIAGFAFARAAWGRILFAAVLCYDLLWHTPFDFAQTRKSNAAMEQATRLILDHSAGRGLLVYDGPPYLYALTGKPFLSPLVFPHHLNHEAERDLSHLRTSEAMDRILAERPGAIATVLYPRNFPVNRDSYDKIRMYAAQNCRVVGIVKLPEQGPPSELVIFGDCNIKQPAKPR